MERNNMTKAFFFKVDIQISNTQVEWNLIVVLQDSQLYKSTILGLFSLSPEY